MGGIVSVLLSLLSVQHRRLHEAKDQPPISHQLCSMFGICSQDFFAYFNSQPDPKRLFGYSKYGHTYYATPG